MGVKAVYILKADEKGQPIVDFRGMTAIHDRMLYNNLLDAFALGPFSFEEALGALQAKGVKPREHAKDALNEMTKTGFVIISE